MGLITRQSSAVTFQEQIEKRVHARRESWRDDGRAVHLLDDEGALQAVSLPQAVTLVDRAIDEPAALLEVHTARRERLRRTGPDARRRARELAPDHRQS